MKILLISANTLTTPYPVYPLGMDYVAAAISTSHDVRVIDMNAFGDTGFPDDMIDAFSPDIIGLGLRNVDNTDISDSNGYIVRYRELVNRIRKCSNALLVLGGSGFTIFPNEMMKALDADYGIVGEGERLSLLIAALNRQEHVLDIPGVIVGSRHRSGTSEPNDPTYAPYKGRFSRRFDGTSSHVDYYLAHGGMLNLQTKRGCNFQCIYCTYPHIEGRRLRLIPPNDVAETAIQLQNAGAKYLFITDSAFNVHVSHSIEVAKAFQKAGLTIPWGAFFSPIPLLDDYFQIMADSGLTHVEFGTESLSEVVLQSYGKPFQTAHVLKAHAAARMAGLHVAHYFLLGGPGENRNTLDQTLSNIDKLTKSVLFFFCGMRIYPHTALYDIALKERQIVFGQSLLEPIFYRSLHISSEDIFQEVEKKRCGRSNWIIGSGGEKISIILSRMYARGRFGPLWEHLIR